MRGWLWGRRKQFSAKRPLPSKASAATFVFGCDGKGLALTVLSSFVPWAGERYCRWCLSQTWFVLFLCRFYALVAKKPWVRKWSFRNKKALLSVTFGPSGRTAFPGDAGWRREEWRPRVIKHRVCTYFPLTGTHFACQSHVFMSLLPSPQGVQVFVLNISAHERSLGSSGKEEHTDLNTLSSHFIFSVGYF